MIDCTGKSRGVPDWDYNATSNTNAPTYTNTVGDYSITVKHTTNGNRPDVENNAYQYFNTQQMAPIVSPTVWEQYYSLNTNSLSIPNSKDEVGLLPESGLFNRNMSDITGWIQDKKREGKSIAQDFTIYTGSDGSFTIFPYYYGTNFEHEIGVYLIDDNGNPILRQGVTPKANPSDYKLSDFVSFPIFHDRQHGDLQIQPHFDSNITDIRLYDESTNTENEIYVDIDEVLDLKEYTQIKYSTSISLNGTEYSANSWIPYTEYLAAKSNSTHSRAAIHIWDQEIDAKVLLSSDCVVKGLQQATAYGRIGIGTSTAEVEGSHAAYAGSSKMVNTCTSRVNGVSHDITVHIGQEKPGSGNSGNGNSGNGNSGGNTTGVTHLQMEVTDGSLSLTVGGESKSATVKCYNGSDEVTDNTIYGQINWVKNSGYTITRSGNVLSVTGNTVGTYEITVYLDENTNDVCDSGEKQTTLRVTVSAAPVVTYKTHTYSQSFTSVPTISGWSNYFNSQSEQVAKPEQIVTIAITTDNIPSVIKDLYYYDSADPAEGTNKTWHRNADKNNNAKDLFEYIFEYFQTDASRFTAWYNTLVNPQVNAIQGGNVIDTSATYTAIYCGEPWNGGTKFNSPSDFANFNEYGWSNFGVYFSKSNGYDEVISYKWKGASEISAAESALATYYSSYEAGAHNCTDCSDWVDFSTDITDVSVTINDNITEAKADITAVDFTVTWTVEKTSQRAPARKGKVKKAASIAKAPAFPDILTDNNTWVEANGYWSHNLPYREEVASYPPNMPMLGRSRGYDVIITVPDGNGGTKPYNGRLGMYMKVIGSHYLSNEGNNGAGTAMYTGSESFENTVTYDDQPAKFDELTFPWVVYSEKKYNKNANKQPYQQVSALSFQHPVTGRTFLSFEDMLVTHAGPDELGGSVYGDRERSSDRDVNDLVFFITNFSSIRDGEDGQEIRSEEVYDEGFPWYWALEDLGSTDDFDFNDVVVKITSITETRKETTKDKDSEEPTTKYTVISKKVSFTPMAAGGTLPVYLHFKVKGTDYVLRPGTFDLTPGQDFVDNTTILPASDLVQAKSVELHGWFGEGYSPREMINTGAGFETSKLGTCVLYVEAPALADESNGALDMTTGFHLNIFTSGNKVVDAAKLPKDNNSIYFYATVNGNSSDGEIYDKKLENEYGILPTGKGAAPQSFIIATKNWRWPSERSHILLAYPDFGQWVSDHTTNWLENFNTSYLY